MIKYFINLLGIGNIPRWLLYHLMLLAFALGGFQAVLFIGAVSEFISNQMMAYFPEAVAFSGLLGILLFGFYKYVTKNFTFRKALLFFYLIILFLLFLALFLPKIFPEIASSVLLFIVLIPLLLIVEQFISGIGERILFHKYHQNIKRFTEASFIAGAVFFSLAINFGALLNIKPYIFLPVFVLLVISAFESNFILKKLEIKKKDEEEKIESVISMFTDIPLKNKVVSILVFLFLSILNFICIDYLFLSNLSKTHENYFNLVSFLGMFYAALMVIMLLFKTFVYQNLIKTFKLNKAIFLSPVFMLFVMVGLLSIMLYQSVNTDSNSFFITFWLIIFARFFAYILRESFELYSLRMIYSAISAYSKKIISPNISNIYSLWGLLFGGLILLLVMSFDLFNVRFIIFLNTLVVILWIVMSFFFVKNYTDIIQKIINQLKEFAGTKDFKKNLSLKERVMITTNLSGLKYLLNFQRYNQPFDFDKQLDEIPANMKDKLGLTKSIINPSDYSTKLHEPSKYQASKSNSLNFYDSDVSVKLTDIEALASSSKIKDRIRAVKMIENSQNYSYTGIFKMLLRDSDDEVKRNALMASVSFYNSDILSEVLTYINHDEFATLVADIIAKIGNDAIPLLSYVFYRTETDIKVQAEILKIVGRIASQQATDFLIDKLNYPNKWIIREAVYSLNENKIGSNFLHNENLHQAILKIIGVSAWLLAKDVSIANIPKTEPLKKALDDEYNLTLDLLFNLLQLKYQNGIIDYVNVNIHRNNSNEQEELFVELLSVVIDDDIKLKLFPLLHNNKKTEKVEQLRQFYPIEKTDSKIAIRDLLRADYEYISIWTRACALKYYIELEENLEAEEIIAQVFNPELLIAEIAFFGIYKKNRKFIEQISDRLPIQLKNRAISVLKKGPMYEYSLTFNKVLCLQKISYFQKIMGHYLVPFAEVLSEIFLSKNESTYLKCSDEEVLPVFFEPYGDATIIDSHKRKIRLNQNYLYGLGLYAGGVTIQAFSDSVFYVAQPEQIGYLVIHYEELSDALFKYIQNSNFY